MENYEFTFGYLALKMLGKTLYSNPFAALSELIANGFDAGADKIWIYIDISNKNNSSIEVIDNGSGMSDDDIKNKYLQVGKLNRDLDNKKMMGRKGIGKLAAFYLSNNYYIRTKNIAGQNSYAIDFRECEKNPKFNNYMSHIDSFDIVNENVFNEIKTGTCIKLNNVNFVGYGDKAFSVLPHDLSEYFSFQDENKEIYLKLIKKSKDYETNFVRITKNIAFKNMTKIYYNYSDSFFSKVIELNGSEIKNADKKVKESKVLINVSKIETKNPTAVVDGKPIILKPYGWIGIHQTIDRNLASKNDSNFINSEYYHFNKVRIYVRNKLALENILPLVHNTQYYANYIEGEIHCDELDDNDFPDIASSSRQDLDKNDDRVIQLIEYVKGLVKDLVNYKGDQAKNDDDNYLKKQSSAVTELSNQVESSLSEYVDKKISRTEIQTIKHSLINSFNTVRDAIKTEYKLFFSHKSDDKKYSDFFYNYLIDVKGFDKDMIFYSSCDGGIDESIESLERQVIDNLTQKNSKVIFYIFSDEFRKSEYCMFEGGAAWAVKQDSTIGLIYSDYDKIPNYLRNMKNSQLLIKDKMSREMYISLARIINVMISYLNNNYINDTDKKELLNEQIPNYAELKQKNESSELYYDKNVISYWNSFIEEK